MGESLWRDEYDDDNAGKKNSVLERLLIDTLSNQRVTACILTSQPQQQPSSTPTPTTTAFAEELIELDSAEDAMIDFGKHREIPAEVRDWTAEATLSAVTVPPPPAAAAAGETGVTFLRTKCLAKQSESAWWEVVCVTTTAAPAPARAATDSVVTPRKFPAIPLALQIEVGNGSWESSLIQPKSSSNTGDAAINNNTGADMVSFDLLLTWPTKS